MITLLKASDTSTALQYIMKEPKIKSEHPPVLILLHGARSNETDLFSFANELPDKYLVISARAPISLGAFCCGRYACLGNCIADSIVSII